MQFWRISRLLFTALALLSLAAGLPAQRRTRPARGESPQYVPGEVLVKFSSATASRAAETNGLVGAETLESLGDRGLQRVRLPAGLSVESAIAVYNTLNGVEYAQPNFYYHRLATPNDPQFSQAAMYGLFKISAPAAWDLSTGNSSIVVADIDTGMRYTHQDLAPNAWTNQSEIEGNGVDDDGNGFPDDVYGWDFFFDDSNPSDADAGGHGTHTAGTIGAAGNNGFNVVGVNWAVKIMPLKIYSSNCCNSTSAILVRAYNYVRIMKQRGVNIVATNNSYGGCGEACGYDQATKDAIDSMGDAGVVNVFAAGNDFGNNNDVSPFFPVSYTSPSIIGVAASDQNDNKASFSNIGVSTVDLAAPGVNILSTWYSSDSATATLQGTSMATPHVTGAVALLASYRPDLSAASLKASILNNVDVLANWNGLVKTGGRLNVFKAMQNPTVCTFDTGGLNGIRIRGLRGQDLSLNVTALQNCDYLVKSNAAWLTITGNNTFSGSGTITYHVDPNTGASARTAIISFGGRTFTVTQRGSGPGR